MTVKILVSIAGHEDPANGLERSFSFRPGDLTELPDGLAAKWIASGIAAPTGAPEAKQKKAR